MNEREELAALRRLAELEAKAAGQPAPAREPDSNAAQFIAGGVAEPILSMASGAVVAPVAGLAGLAVAPFAGAGRGADVTRWLMDKAIYQPQTTGGKATSEKAFAPFHWLATKGDQAGQVVSDATGSQALGAATNTAVQFVPQVLAAKGIGMGFRAADAGVKSVQSAIKQRGYSNAQAATAEAEAAAQVLAARAGMDWAKLPDQIRAQIIQVAKESRNMENLPPQALEREARMASHPVPIYPMQGQATRNPQQLRMEKQISNTEGGAELRQRIVEQNRQLQENLDVLRGRTGSRVAEGSKEQAGGVVQLAARGNLKAKQQEVSRLYDKAEKAGEMEAHADIGPVVNHYLKSVDPAQIEYAMGFLKRANAIEVASDGAVHVRRGLALKELQRLRSAAATIARKDPSTRGHESGQLVGVIDSIMDATEAGPLYRAATAARKAQGAEFERQGSVSKLVSEKAGTTDNRVALENTWKSVVLDGSIQDLRNAMRTLATSPDTRVSPDAKGVSVNTKTMGRRAIKELAAQTVDYIKAEATKATATMETGEATVNAAGFVRAVDRIGQPKLKLLLGETATAELNSLVKTARDLLTEPPSRIVGSNTFEKLLAWTDKYASKLPVLGPVASGVAKYGKMAYEKGLESRRITEAQQTPYRFGERANALAEAREKVRGSGDSSNVRKNALSP